jgi:DNA/RNA-binding domain of Phe-tRNA-synthetase-like protein
MPIFRYHPDVIARFPNLCGGIIFAEGMTNQATPEDVQQMYIEEQQATLRRLGNFSPADIAPLAAWRAAFRAFGVEPTKYRSAAEALLRRLTKKGDIPSINLMVDLYNLVSIRYALPMAAFDLRSLNGDLTVRFANGDERFTAHDEPEAGHPEPGEVIFVDDAGLIFARRWCWKQSLESSTGLDTTAALITIEAHHSGAEREVRAAMEDIVSLLGLYAGGSFRMAVLGAGKSAEMKF